MRVGLTYLFDFWFEKHASQAVSTENFPFWVQENGPVLESGTIFEKIVNLSKNFQKLFFKQLMLNKHGTYSSRCATSDRRQWKIAPGLKGGRQRKVAPGLNGGSRRLVATESCPLFGWCRSSLQTVFIGGGRTLGHSDDEDGHNKYMDTVALEALATRLWDEIETIAWTETLWKRWGLDFMMKLPTYPKHGNQASRSSG